MERYAGPGEGKSWKLLAELWLGSFILLSLITVSFPHQWLPVPATRIAQPFDWLARFTGTHVFGVAVNERTVSDGMGMQVHFLNLLVLALPFAGLLCQAPSGMIARWRSLLFVAVRYFLAWQLLLYGCNKLFKWQFYLPEPSIQYSEVHQLNRDILYWTAMGTSRSYSVFLGSTEVVAALFLMWRKTMLAGGLLAFGILVNVLMVNIGFDISVRLHTCFLLLLTIFILAHHKHRLAGLLLITRSVGGDNAPVARRNARTVSAKLLVILLLSWDALYPYVHSRNFNDDAAPRPPLYGAYGIQASSNYKWKRFFIHRRGYFILQDSSGTFSDYELSSDTAAHALWLSRPVDSVETALYYNWTNDSTLSLQGWIGPDSVVMMAHRLSLRTPNW